MQRLIDRVKTVINKLIEKIAYNFIWLGELMAKSKRTNVTQKWDYVITVRGTVDASTLEDAELKLDNALTFGKQAHITFDSSYTEIDRVK